MYVVINKDWGLAQITLHDELSHTAGIAYSNSQFGAGTGPIFLDDVQCSSSASQLLECSSQPILAHDCLHTADAGVGCEGKSQSWCQTPGTT